MSIHNYNGVRRDHLDSTSSFLSPLLLLVKVTPLFAYWLQIAPGSVSCNLGFSRPLLWSMGTWGTSTSEAAESRVAEPQTKIVVCQVCV